MNTIIITTDFSEIADNAMEYAAELAKLFDAKLVLFNAFKLSVHASNTLLPAAKIQELLNENHRRLKGKADHIAAKYNIETAFESNFSFMEEELTSLVDKYDADLVVFGMASKTFEQDLLGNNTTMAIRKMSFPVLAVPIGAKFKGIKNVLFACDILHGIPAKILTHIKAVAADLKSNVEVFYVDEKIEELKANDKEVLATDLIHDGLDGITYSHKSVRSNAVIREIEKEIIAYEADLLIMVPKKYGFWASIVHKSKTRMMASGLNIPLLSIPVSLERVHRLTRAD